MDADSAGELGTRDRRLPEPGEPLGLLPCGVTQRGGTRGPQLDAHLRRRSGRVWLALQRKAPSRGQVAVLVPAPHLRTGIRVR